MHPWFPFSEFSCLRKLFVSLRCDVVYHEHLLVLWQLIMLTACLGWIEAAQMQFGFWWVFFWLWQFLINFVCIQLWQMFRAEMRKPCLKIRLFYSIKYNSRTMLCLGVKLTIVHVDWWCFFLCSSRYLECWNTYSEELNGYSAFSVDCVMEHYMC